MRRKKKYIQMKNKIREICPKSRLKETQKKKEMQKEIQIDTSNERKKTKGNKISMNESEQRKRL